MAGLGWKGLLHHPNLWPRVWASARLTSKFGTWVAALCRAPPWCSKQHLPIVPTRRAIADADAVGWTSRSQPEGLSLADAWLPVI